MAKDLAQSFMRLFGGMSSAYGTYRVSDSGKKGVKNTGRAQTHREPLTIAQWRNHLAGKIGLGVIPIREDNTVVWGCLDIDEYHLDLQKLAKKINELKLPLLVCRTKSGGAHVFAFFAEPVPAAACQDMLKEVASTLGFGGCEIFPKQTEVLLERGDLGNWLNMPYFGAEKTTRYAVKPDGSPATPKEFLEAANNIKLSPAELDGVIQLKGDQLVPEGPPCLQALCALGFPEGQRNNGLFALGTYCRKAHPESWKQKLTEYNQSCVSPPVEPDEIASIVKQHERKEYNYKCSEQPLAAHCNAAVCRTRKYGVGQGSSFPTLGGLTKLDTEPPLWFLEVEGSRLELATDQLQDPQRFAKVCIETINVFPPPVTRATWQQMVDPLLRDVIIIEQPEDTKALGQFADVLYAFCEDKALAPTRDDILRGVAWRGEINGKDWIWFRMEDLLKFIRRQGDSQMKRHYIAARIRDLGGDHKQVRFAGNKNLIVWGVPPLGGGAELDTPEIEEDPM